MVDSEGFRKTDGGMYLVRFNYSVIYRCKIRFCVLYSMETSGFNTVSNHGNSLSANVRYFCCFIVI